MGMFTESRDMWKKFDSDFREMACMNNNIMLEEPMEMGGKKELSNNEARTLARQDSKARWEEGWMFPRRWMLPSLNAPLKDFDLFKTKDSELIRVKEDDTKMVSKSFSRKYTLPQGSRGQDVVSNLSSDGVLVITAPKNNPAITNVPVGGK